MRSTYLLQPSCSPGHQGEQSSRWECLLLLPHHQPFCPASSLFVAWRSQFCQYVTGSGNPLASRQKEWIFVSLVIQCCFLDALETGIILKGTFAIWLCAGETSTLSLVSVCWGDTVFIRVVGMPFLLCIVCKSLETFLTHKFFSLFPAWSLSVSARTFAWMDPYPESCSSGITPSYIPTSLHLSFLLSLIFLYQTCS